MTPEESARENIGPDDKILECRECCKQFLWTAGEQQYFSLHALNAPKRCAPCRRTKNRAQRGAGA